MRWVAVFYLKVKRYVEIKKNQIYNKNFFPRKTAVNVGVLDNNQLLAGRTAIITGGTSGIGLAIAKSFVRSDVFVVITGRYQK